MSRSEIPKALLAAVFVWAIQLPDAAWSRQTEPVTNGGIHDSFKDQLKAAAKGEPTDTDAIDDAIKSAVKRQIELFVGTAMMTADEETMEIARRAGESPELVDCLVTILTFELRNESIHEMEAQSIRDTLNELDIRINWDYSISTEAIPPEKTVVRIRLPTLHACGGCKQILESALNSTEGFVNAVVDLETLTAQFLAQESQDIESKLDELKKSEVQQLADWQLIRK